MIALKPYYIIQLTDTYQFICKTNDGRIELVGLFANAYRFDNFDSALNHARIIDDGLSNITIIHIWDNVNMETLIY